MARKIRIEGNEEVEKEDLFVTVVLDESGSMADTYDATISGFNEYIQTLQNKIESKVKMSLVTFNSEKGPATVFALKPISEVPKLNKDSYQPNGGTPLYDALGKAIQDAEKEIKGGSRKKVLFIIITDGMENSSRAFTKEMIKEKIVEKEDKDWGWTFVYLGSNQDSWSTGGGIGIRAVNTSNYASGSLGAYVSMKRLAADTVSYASRGFDSAIGFTSSNYSENFTKDEVESYEDTTKTPDKNLSKSQSKRIKAMQGK